MLVLVLVLFSTCDLLVKVRLGRLTLRLGDERVVFNLFDTLKQSSLFSFYSFIEFVSIFYVLMEGSFPSVGMSNPLKRVLTDEDLD